MPFFSLPNLSATEVTPIEPWTINAALPQFPDKNAYRVWSTDPTTEGHFISAVEGKVPGLRVSEVNPAARLHGLVIDFDAVPDAPPEQSLLFKAPTDLRPAWVSRTFSGHCRVLYLFEAPVTLYTKDIARAFLVKC